MEDTGEDKKMEGESCTDVQEELRHGIERMDIGKDVVPGATHIAFYGPFINIASGEAPITIGNIEQGATHTFDRVGTVLENAPGNSEVTTGSATFASSSSQDVKGDKEAVVSKPQSANDFSELRKRYREECSKHEINCVEHGRVKPLESNIQDFSVNLRIRKEESSSAANKNFQGEIKRHMEALKDHGQTIEVEELINMLQEDNKGRIFFVGGVAGIGKSVLAKRIAYDWSCSEKYGHVKCLLYLTCRELNNFLHKSDKEIQIEEIEKYLKEKLKIVSIEDDEATLFLIDGLDELQEPGMIRAFTKRFSKSNFIILGRPHSEHFVDTIKERYQKLEILGLNENQIQEFIEKFDKLSTDKTENQPSTEQKINKSIEKSRNISAMTTIPQFLTTLCCIAMLSTENMSISNNTSIYCWMLFLLTKQHFQGKESDNKAAGCEIFSHYSEQLLAICKQAFQLYNSGSIIFKKTELECKDEQFIEGFLLGIKNPFGNISKYMFKHLTIMEFLASIHVYLDGKRNELLKKLLREERYEIISFVCSFGKDSLKDDDNDIVNNMMQKLGCGKRLETGLQALLYVFKKLKKLHVEDELRYKLKFRFTSDYLSVNDKDTSKKLLSKILKKISPGFFSPGSKSKVTFRADAFDQSNIINILRLATGNEVANSEIKNAFSGIKFDIDDLREMEILDYALWIDIDGVELIDVNHFTADQSMLVHRNMAFCGDVLFDNCKVPLFTTNANESTTKMKLKELGMVRMRIDQSESSSAANLFRLAEEVELDDVRFGGNEFEKMMEKVIQIKPRRLKEIKLWSCPLVNHDIKQKMKENGVKIIERDPRSILLLCEPDSRDFVLQLKEKLDDTKHYIAMDENIEEFKRRYNELPRILVVFIQHQIPEDVERDILFARNEEIRILLVKLEADFHRSKELSSVFDSIPCLDFTDKRNNAEMAGELNWNIPAIMDLKFIVISNAPGNQVEAIQIKQKFADEIGCPVLVNIKLWKYEPRVVVFLLTDKYEKSQQCKEMMEYARSWIKIIAVKLDNNFQPGNKLNNIVRESTCICWTDETNFDTNFAKVKEDINAKFARL